MGKGYNLFPVESHFINFTTYLDLAGNTQLISNNAAKKQSLGSGAKSLQ